MKKLTLIFAFLGITFLFLVSCGGNKEKTTEQSPSDSLKTAVAQSLESYATTIMGSISDTSQVLVILQAYLDANMSVYGSAFAFAPILSESGKTLNSYYTYRTAEGYASKKLEQSYDYTKEQWYSSPVENKKAMWSDPYFDEGGGNAQMITYGIPLYTADSLLIGVITADLEIKK